jgi:inner membrane protein involved in colicin E2 resistance
MLEVFVVAIASFFGTLLRALLKERKRSISFYLCLSVFIGICFGLFSFFARIRIFEPLLSFKSYLGIFFVFFMLGWVLSDLFETFIFVAKRKRVRR